jgi:hypothetical protein
MAPRAFWSFSASPEPRPKPMFRQPDPLALIWLIKKKVIKLNLGFS